jgi:hypothetical protein
VPKNLLEKIEHVTPGIRVNKVLQMSMKEARERYDLSYADVVTLRKELSGLNHMKQLPASERWKGRARKLREGVEESHKKPPLRQRRQHQ